MSDAIIHTSEGDIALTFFDHCPDAVGNFVDHAADGDYNGTEFHERVPGFIIQGGDTGSDNPDDYLLDEYAPDGAVLFDQPYRVACAGRGDFSHPSIFFVTLAPAPHLDWKHTIFGEVTDPASRAVVDAINAAPRTATITINSIEIAGPA